VTNFGASLTKLTALFPQLHNFSCYVSKSIQATPPIWLQKQTDLRTYDSANSPCLWRQSRLVNVTCVWNQGLCGINPTTIFGNVRKH